MDARHLAGLGILAGGAGLLWAVSSRAFGSSPAVDSSSDAGGGAPLLEEPALLGGRNIVETYLQGSGLSADQASGVAAGIYAESGLDPNAVNPSSGAYGIGQWLGARKAALFAQYGPNPSLADQLQFLVWELNGGDPGGKAVLSQQTPAATLDAYVRKFMRPAPGAETSGDLARGAGYLANG